MFSQVDLMEARGNERTNAEYEWHGVSGVWKPVHDEGRDYREVFIRSKYRDKKFMRAQFTLNPHAATNLGIESEYSAIRVHPPMA